MRPPALHVLASWCFDHRRAVIVAWVVALVGLGVGAINVGPAFTSDANLPDSQSTTAYRVLHDAGLGSDGVQTGTIAWHAVAAPIDDPAVQREVAAVLDTVRHQPGVLEVTSAYDDAGRGQLDHATATAYATVVLSDQADPAAIRTAVEQAVTPGGPVQVTAGGQAFTEMPAPSPATEAVGIGLALVVLLLVFGSRWAAALPIITGVVGVAASLLTVVLASHLLDLPDESITMASMIGLGVGIDYALFVLYRHRRALVAGEASRDACVQAVTASGRAVVFAALTVIVALAAMVVVQFSLVTAMAAAAAMSVLFTMLTAYSARA
ncbi:MAG: MMPL family transporter, partial [Micrococcales bacterium]|nr:MMPL family transporter [Micrococcales bacterium]